ncbi:hypothetical protein BDV28DRAFT_152913 [Aspergillus coremiiformis]|uniref:Uncharacterized protein n=1 Tax=Aspergillus coremiiformis TaxID=138285 RepID=A0A5N6YVD8_9EURO|nr:hypothetical protein BDV28DRAFT_152913 [Aspergillus coremiiformis]
MKLAVIIAFSLSTLALAAPANPVNGSSEEKGHDLTKDLTKSLLGSVTKALRLGPKTDA